MENTETQKILGVDRYFICESHPSNTYVVWDRERGKPIGAPLPSKMEMTVVCEWLNKSKLKIDIE